MTKLLFEKLTYQIRGAAMEVYNRIGPFMQESVYQRSMEIELRHLGIPFEFKWPVAIRYRGSVVGSGEIDLLVDDEIVVELKAASTIHPRHVSQVIQYLAAIERPLGLILNFGNIERFEARRVPFSRNLEKLRSRCARSAEESDDPDQAGTYFRGGGIRDRSGA